MTIRLPKYAPGDTLPFDGTPGQRASNILSHAWEQEKNPINETTWLTVFKTPRPEFLARCSQCNAVGKMTETAQWPCGDPRRADTYIW
jgi:hypothetical protein